MEGTVFFTRTNWLFFPGNTLCLQPLAADASTGWWHPQWPLKAAEPQQWQMGRNYEALPRDSEAQQSLDSELYLTEGFPFSLPFFSHLWTWLCQSLASPHILLPFLLPRAADSFHLCPSHLDLWLQITDPGISVTYLDFLSLRGSPGPDKKTDNKFQKLRLSSPTLLQPFPTQALSSHTFTQTKSCFPALKYQSPQAVRHSSEKQGQNLIRKRDTAT